MVCESHVRDVTRVYVVVEGLLDEVLGLVPGQLGYASVEEDQFEIEAGSEHEHVAIETDFRHGAAWQRVAHGNQSDVLVTLAIDRCHRMQTGCELAHLQISAAVDHLGNTLYTKSYIWRV